MKADQISNLDEVLQHLLDHQHTQMYIIEALLLRAGFTADELSKIIQEAQLDKKRQRLDHFFKQNSGGGDD